MSSEIKEIGPELDFLDILRQNMTRDLKDTELFGLGKLVGEHGLDKVVGVVNKILLNTNHEKIDISLGLENTDGPFGVDNCIKAEIETIDPEDMDSDLGWSEVLRINMNS